ncbi:MAG: hypothetical protein HHJ12_06210 [Glaciimonas sp.]|nr:hypothetical protein [Glaciimonas sp.]
MKHPAGMRILWQSSTAIARLPFYAEAIRSHAHERCAVSTMLEVRGAPGLLPDAGTLRFFDFLNNRTQSQTAVLNVKFHEDLIAKYGLEKHPGSLICFELPFEERKTRRSGNPAACLDRILQAVAQDVQAILRSCGLGIRNGLTEVDGAPIFDALRRVANAAP